MNEQFSSILKNLWTTHIAVGFICVGGGVGVGYFLWGREPKYEANVPENFIDVDGLADVYQIVKDDDSTNVIFIPETTATVFNDSVIIESPDTDTDFVQVNVFDIQDPTWDWEEEIANRKETEPYVLHRDEFYQNELNYTQSTLTYYSGDDIMSDEDDVPVFDYKQITGVLLFGKGSGDPNTVLVRNDSNKAEYEILNDPGRFEVEVLGLDFQDDNIEDVKHSKTYKFKEY